MVDAAKALRMGEKDWVDTSDRDSVQSRHHMDVRGITRRTSKENIAIDGRGKDTEKSVIDVLHDKAGSPGIRVFLGARYGMRRYILDAVGCTDDKGRLLTEPMLELIGQLIPSCANFC
jgi:hypothetical protein